MPGKGHKSPTPSAHGVPSGYDLLTQNWEWGSELGLIAFALLGAARVKTGPAKDLFWAQSLVLTVLLCFGGGIIGPFMLGKPPVILTNDLFVPTAAVCWFLVNRFEKPVLGVLRAPVIAQTLEALAEIFRANGLCKMVVEANKVIKAGPHYPIPIWGPILLGTIAGCGGLFLPLDKGLHNLKQGSPWPLQSAFFGAALYHILAHDPHFKQQVSPLLRGWGSEREIQAAVALFLAGVAVVQTISPHYNPFAFLHKVIYTVIGIKNPQQSNVSAPAVSQPAAGSGDKKKD